MKFINTFLIIFILQVFTASCNYYFEIIKELIPKTAIFETRDSNTYKIYKYIPSCSDNNIYNKNIYLQFLGNGQNSYFYIYFYDYYDNIAQDKHGQFINYINRHNIINNPYRITSLEVSILISNLNCSQHYYVAISNTISNLNDYVSGFIFNIIDADIDIINLSPELSDFFSFHKKKTKMKL